MTPDQPDESPAELYAEIKAEFERLVQNTASRSDWLQLSYKLLTTMMRCQQFVMAKQKAALAYARGETTGETFRNARHESRDAIHVLDKLNELHERIRSRLVG